MPGQLGRRRVAVRADRLDRDLRRVVAAEVRGVDHDPVHHARARRAARSRGHARARGGAGSPSRRRPCPCGRTCPRRTPAASGLIRFSFSANSSSLANTTLPPSWRDARSGSTAKPGHAARSVGAASLASSRPLGRSTGHRRAAQPGPPDHPGQRLAGVRGQPVPVIQPGRIDDERLIRRERHQVGVARPERSGPCGPGRPRRAGSLAIQRATSVSRVAPRRGPGSRPRAARSARRRSRPRRPRSRRARRRLSAGGHGEWSDTTQSMVPVAERRPQPLAVGPAADRRAALELGRAVRDLLGGEGQVVRAGLGGDRHPVPPGRGDQPQRVGAGQVQDVHPGAGRPASAGSPCATAAVSADVRPRPQEAP